MNSSTAATAPPLASSPYWYKGVAKTDSSSLTKTPGDIYRQIPADQVWTIKYFGSTEQPNQTALFGHAEPEWIRQQISINGPGELQLFRYVLPSLNLSGIEVSPFDAAIVNVTYNVGANSTAPFPDIAGIGTDDPALEPPWLGQLTSRIYQFSLQHENWDSYGAKRISGDAVKKSP